MKKKGKIIMSKKVKSESGICPKCGETEHIEFGDIDFEKTIDGHNMIQRCYCQTCKTEFDDYFVYTYTVEVK